jgi:cysteinyl-tRNA synthetase
MASSTLAFIVELQGTNYSSLSSTNFEVGIVDPDGSGLTASQISDLESSGKTLLAYLSIGLANDYRSYWLPSWNTSPPSFILGADKNWPGAYYVAFWSPDWQQIVINEAVALAKEGYDGVDLDVVDAYLLSNVAAADGGIAKARADMVNFVEAISVATKAVNPNFKIVQNNALDLLTINPDDPTSVTNASYLSYIDGVLAESTFYLPDNSQPVWSTYNLQYAAHAEAAGKTVFSIDYPSSTAAQQDFINQAIANGFVPYAATPDQSLGATIESVNYQIPNLLPSDWLSVFMAVAPPLNAPALNAPTYTGSASSGHWNLSGVATTATTLNIYDRTQTSASNPTGLIATVAVTAANGSWSYTGLLSNSADSGSVAHDFYATVTGASGAVSSPSGDYWVGTSGNDTFTFGLEQALYNGGVWGNGGTDAIVFSAPTTLTDADFAKVYLGGLTLPSGTTANSTAMTLTLNGASAVTLGANASNAKITTVNAGNGNTSITDGNSGTLIVNAAAMASTATMTLSSGSGTESFNVTGLDSSLNATNVKGALSVTTAAVSNLTIATAGGSAATNTINASAMTSGQTLTLTGNRAATAAVGGNLSASAYTGALTVTATGTAAQTITTGSGADTITGGVGDTINGRGGADTITGGPSDTITGGAGNDTFVYTNGANSLYSAYDTITDFSVSGTDHFKIGHTVTSWNFHSLTHAASGNLYNDLAALLTSSNFAAQGADLVTLTGSASDSGSYVIINNAGVAGFNGGLDAVIKLTAGAANVHASSFIG